MSQCVVLGGASGDLGKRVLNALMLRGATVRAIVRNKASIETLPKHPSVERVVVEDYREAVALTKTCEGASCVVSALSGLREVIVDAQTDLLGAAIKAGVKRFFPSDFAIDYTQLPPGQNRNLDLRREFKSRLDDSPVEATSLLNGMFTDLLLGKAPIILKAIRRVLYFGNADQALDFTTRDDVADFTAKAVLEEATPRFLRISGERVTPRELTTIATSALGSRFKLLRGGSVGSLSALARVARALSFSKNKLYPAWQGMQYLRDMFDGRGLLDPLDNDRYPNASWTTVEKVLKAGQERPLETR